MDIDDKKSCYTYNYIGLKRYRMWTLMRAGWLFCNITYNYW